MLGTAVAIKNGPLWAVALFAVLLVSVHKGWQYLLERQRHRYAERIAEKIRPDVMVKLGEGPSSVQVRCSPVVVHADGQPPPEGIDEPATASASS